MQLLDRTHEDIKIPSTHPPCCRQASAASVTVLAALRSQGSPHPRC
ncbi:hypothetical protein [Streptomyces anthocyanicus]|nr:hypothetical protein [Streptomyces anthocyanicus]